MSTNTPIFDSFEKETQQALLRTTQEAVNGLMFNKAFFSKRDFIRALESKIGREYNGRKFDDLLPELIVKIALVPLFPNQPENQWTQYSTARMIRLEREMVEMAKAKSPRHEIPGQPNIVKELVDKAFASRPTMADEQKAVVMASCITDDNVVITEGTAGAGKSFSLNAIREVYESIPPRHPGEQKGYAIIGTALSWTATKVLEESAGLSGGMAIEGFVRKIKEAKSNGKDFFTRRTVVIIDEAGLAPTELVHQILLGAKESKQDVRVILTGDSLQLNPVQAGNALELLVEECGSTRLDTIRRQKQASHRQAVKHFCFGRAEKGLYSYHQQEAVHFLKNKDEVLDKVVADYVAYTSHYPEKSALVLALKNADVGILNAKIRAAMKAVGRIADAGVTISAYDGKIKEDVEFCVGDQIVFRQNAPKHPVHKSVFAKTHEAVVDAKKKYKEKQTILGWVKHSISGNSMGDEIRKGIFNRTIGTILDIKPGVNGSHNFRILLSEGGEVVVNSKEFVNRDNGAMPIMHNFATTIYASQGQTVAKVMMLDDPNVNRKLAYVAASRHTELFDIYLNCDELGERIRKKVDRERGKAEGKIQKEMQRSSSSIFSEIEDNRLYDQYPIYPKDHVFSDREYLGVVASTWNTASLNQTVTMARKQSGGRMKRDPHWKSPLAPWFASIHKEEEDDWNDHPETGHVNIPGAVIKSAVKEIPKKGFMGKIFGTTIEAEVTFAELPQPINPEPDALLGVDTSKADLEGVEVSNITGTKGKLWHLNRYTQARILALDPHSQIVRAQYTLDGQRVVGDGEIPVYKNKNGTSQTPFLIVQSFREAEIAYHHYRQKLGEDNKLVPHIVCALPGVKLNTLLPWLPPQPNVYLAHGKRPGSLEKAKEISKSLEQLQVPFDFRPRLDGPVKTNEVKAPPKPQRPKFN